MKSVLTLVSFILLLFFSTVGFSQTVVSPTEQVDFLIRILKYNKTIEETEGAELRIGIVYADNPDSKKSYQAYDDALFEKVKAKENIVGKKLTYSGLLFTTGADFLK